MRLLEIGALFDDDRSGGNRRNCCCRVASRVGCWPKGGTLDHRDHIVMPYIPGSGDNEIFGRELLFVILTRLFTIKAPDGLGRSRDVAPQRVPRKKRRVEEIAQRVLGRVVDHLRAPR